MSWLGRYLRLRASAVHMRLRPRWWWTSSRLLLALFNEQVRRSEGWPRVLPKQQRLLDFRSYHQARETQGEGK